MSTIAERILIRLSRPPAEVVTGGSDHWNSDNALSLLERVYPDLHEIVAGKDVLDFGCGQGWQAVALVRNGARSVVGLDIVPETLARARRLAEREGVTDQVLLYRDPSPLVRADVVISQNSMEHFPDPLGALRQMRNLLRPNGVALVTFGPPWFAPFGHHCHYFAPIPWLNLLFPERAVVRVRSRYVDDGATCFEEATGGLNRMTVGKFERLVREAGFSVERQTYDMVKGLPQTISRLPVVRELLVNRVSAVLRVPRHQNVHPGSEG